MSSNGCRLAQHAGISGFQRMSKNSLYEELLELGHTRVDRIRRYEQRTSGTPIPASALFVPPVVATSSSGLSWGSDAGSKNVRKRKADDFAWGIENVDVGASAANSNSLRTSNRSSNSRKLGAKKTHRGKGLGLDSSSSSTSSSSSSSSSTRSGSRMTSSGEIMKKPKRLPAPLNKVDPIMFVPLKKKSIWKFQRPHGSAVAFNADSLADFMLATGDFNDPETRIPFTDDNLREIDTVLAKAATSGGKARASVLEAKRNPAAYEEARHRRDALEGLERCAGDVIADILNIIETADPDDAQMRLVIHELPVFADFYRQLHEADPAYAKQCLEHWSRFIAGPPNNPNTDMYGLIDCVKHYLQMCGEAQQGVGAGAGAGAGGIGLGVGGIVVPGQGDNGDY